MKLTQIERRTGLTREEFQKEYLAKLKPVVFTDLVADWPATNKWDFDWLRDNYGHLKVDLIDGTYHKPGPNYMKPKKKDVKFGDYLTLIQNEPTDLRIFLWNIFQQAPELTKDFSMPKIMDGWYKKHPFMFFGGAGSKVSLHYDIDCSSVFLTQFQTRKRVVLFGPEQSKYLYQHPFTVQSHANVSPPDYNKFPALRKAEGLETTLTHGETIYIPSTFWHYIEYTDGGYGLSLRANDSIVTKMRGVWNISRHFVVDKGMNAVMGDKWKELKVNWAEKRATEMA